MAVGVLVGVRLAVGVGVAVGGSGVAVGVLVDVGLAVGVGVGGLFWNVQLACCTLSGFVSAITLAVARSPEKVQLSPVPDSK